jgi:hypothetical protein
MRLDVPGLPPKDAELGRTLTDGHGRSARGLQNRLRASRIQAPIGGSLRIGRGVNLAPSLMCEAGPCSSRIPLMELVGRGPDPSDGPYQEEVARRNFPEKNVRFGSQSMHSGQTSSPGVAPGPSADREMPHSDVLESSRPRCKTEGPDGSSARSENAR